MASAVGVSAWVCQTDRKVDNIDTATRFNQRNMIIVISRPWSDERMFAQPSAAPTPPTTSERAREHLNRQLEITVAYHVHEDGHSCLGHASAAQTPRPEEVVLRRPSSRSPRRQEDNVHSQGAKPV